MYPPGLGRHGVFDYGADTARAFISGRDIRRRRAILLLWGRCGAERNLPLSLTNRREHARTHVRPVQPHSFQWKREKVAGQKRNDIRAAGAKKKDLRL